MLAHRDELLRQAAEKIAIADPTLALGVGFVAARRDDVHAPVVVGSVQTLARASRLAKLPRRFDTVVVDEGHHVAARSYRRILEHLSPTPLILGVTATPARADGKQLGDVWQEIVYPEDHSRDQYSSSDSVCCRSRSGSSHRFSKPNTQRRLARPINHATFSVQGPTAERAAEIAEVNQIATAFLAQLRRVSRDGVPRTASSGFRRDRPRSPLARYKQPDPSRPSPGSRRIPREHRDAPGLGGYDNPAQQADAQIWLTEGGTRRVLVEVERGGTVTNGHDLKDMWKAHRSPS